MTMRLALALLLAACTSAAPLAPPSPIPATTLQLVVVTTPSWSATTGTLQRYTRIEAGWRAEGDAIAVNVGRTGLGWGRGLHDAAVARRGEPQKREGDGRAPAGAFRLTGAFGYADSLATGLPYHAAQPSSVCVDDPASAFYNRVFDPAATGAVPDWTSRETMRRPDALYRIGAVVAHNGPTADSSWAGLRDGAAPSPGAGSCIFLHVQRGSGQPTVGCTSMPDTSLAAVLAWLDADADPVLVQLPEAVYRRLRSRWRLP